MQLRGGEECPSLFSRTKSDVLLRANSIRFLENYARVGIKM